MEEPMSQPFSLRRVGLWLALGLVALVAGLIVANRFFEVPPVVTAAAVLLAGAVLAGFREVIKAYADRIVADLQVTKAKIDDNTVKTELAIKVAGDALEQVDYRQQVTALSLELDDARRRLALMESLGECLPCRLRIKALLVPAADRRRSLAPLPTGDTPPRGMPQEPTR